MTDLSAATMTPGRRLIVEVLRARKGATSRVSLMKWLFLLARETSWGQENSPYDFVPYKYGPFSFLASRDLGKLQDTGALHGTDGSVVLAEGGYPGLPEARDAIGEVLSRYGRQSAEALMAYAYREYPWYAMLTERTDLAPTRPRRTFAAPAIYTIGYAGHTIDSFLSRLLEEELAGVVDVRREPSSRVYGFQSGTLARYLGCLGLDYVSRRALGIPSRERRGPADGGQRAALLSRYRQRVSGEDRQTVAEFAALIARRPLALVCVERDPADCHRGVLAEVLGEQTGLGMSHL